MTPRSGGSLLHAMKKGPWTAIKGCNLDGVREKLKQGEGNWNVLFRGRHD